MKACTIWDSFVRWVSLEVHCHVLNIVGFWLFGWTPAIQMNLEIKEESGLIMKKCTFITFRNIEHVPDKASFIEQIRLICS